MLYRFFVIVGAFGQVFAAGVRVWWRGLVWKPPEPPTGGKPLRRWIDDRERARDGVGVVLVGLVLFACLMLAWALGMAFTLAGD